MHRGEEIGEEEMRESGNASGFAYFIPLSFEYSHTVQSVSATDHNSPRATCLPNFTPLDHGFHFADLSRFASRPAYLNSASECERSDVIFLLAVM